MRNNIDVLDFTGFCFQSKCRPAMDTFENWFRRTFHKKTTRDDEIAALRVIKEAEDLLFTIEHPDGFEEEYLVKASPWD